jgi:hypothetical protein
MTPASFLARLCALIPPPRYALTRFHGVLAPRAKLRPRIGPKLPDTLASGSAPALLDLDLGADVLARRADAHLRSPHAPPAV